MTDWLGKPFKAQARTAGLSDIGYRHRSLWLPAHSCVCVIEAVEKGVLDPATSEIICVERDPAIFARMVETIRQIGFKHPPLLLRQELSRVELPFPLDYANLDFCGSLTEDVTWWVYGELAPKLNPEAAVVLTCRYGWRNNPFIQHCEHRIQNDYRVIAEEIVVKTASRHDLEIVPLFVFLSAISDHIAHTTALRYRDFNEEGHGQPMMFYRMDNLRRGRSGLPTLHGLMEGFVSGSSEAAQKAWATRRRRKAEAAEEAARRLFERRSLAAKKAWVTRRKKPRIEIIEI